MKKKQLISTLVATFLLFSASSCQKISETIGDWTDTSKELCSPATATRLSYQESKQEPYLAFLQKTNIFGARFAAEAYFDHNATQKKNENFVVSPISVFMALGMAAECANHNTRAEILDALGVSLAELQTYYPLLYRSLNVEHTDQGYIKEVTTGQLDLSNSIWLDNDLLAKDSCLDTLGNNYYCFARSVDFDGDNKKANQSISHFIKKQTKGLIDKDYELSVETLFTLINTLYLKDLWNRDGNPLQKTDNPIPFSNTDGTAAAVKLLMGYYETGRAYESESFTGFYTTTYNGYMLKFLVPNEGYTVNDIFTEENLKTFNALTDFHAVDDEQRIIYHTRCLFPEYEASFDKDVKEVLQENFGINDLFHPDHCDFSGLTDSPAYCESVTHSVSLTVDERGIEGAAVTVMDVCGNAGPGEYTDVYLDFLVDRAFGFVLTDYNNTPIFSGIVKKI